MPANRYGSSVDTTATDVVDTFYAAVDTKDFGLLETVVSPTTYSASFGPGCAIIGGAHHCGEATMTYAQFVNMIAADDPRVGGTITRELEVSGDGSMVINHYSLPDSSHGTAVHYVQGGMVSNSFWYGGSVNKSY